MTISTAKTLINKCLAAFCRAFAAEDVDIKKHNILEYRTPSANAQSGCTAEHAKHATSWFCWWNTCRELPKLILVDPALPTSVLALRKASTASHT